MRQLIGQFVLIAGVAGLGLYGVPRAAHQIETRITDAANVAAAQTRHGVTARVTGRDVTLVGLALDAAEVAHLTNRFGALPGVRMVDVSGLTILPDADPYGLTLTILNGTVASAQGVMPTAAERARISGVLGVEPGVFALAGGLPDDNWTQVIEVAHEAAGPLVTGRIVLMDRRLRIEGVVPTPPDRDAVLGAFSDLPPGYDVEVRIDTQDDGTPPRLFLSVTNGILAGSGKLPLGVASDGWGLPAGLDLEQGLMPTDAPGWAEAASLTITALQQLIEGEAHIESDSIMVSGRGTPDALGAVRAQLAVVPSNFDVRTELSLWDDGAPMTLAMTWDGSTAVAEGKFPAGFTPGGPAGIAVTSTHDQSFLPDDDGAFTANANAGVAALGLLNTGSLLATANAIELEGTATSPQVLKVIDSVLSTAAAGSEITHDISYLDDGTPAAWVLSYDARAGATIEGRLPADLSVEALSTALGGIAMAGAPTVALADESGAAAKAVLDAISGYLQDSERLILTAEQGAFALDLILSPGVDIDLVATELATTLPVDVAFSIGPLVDLPANGATRTNAATGDVETFRSGVWQPELSFPPTFAICAEETRATLNRRPISFVADSVRLDAASSGALNRLAAIVSRCAQVGLMLEVGVYAEITDDPFADAQSSQARANAVRSALIIRGAPGLAISAYGFEISEPGTDSETEMGQIRHGRLEITWYEPGALRDP